MPRFALDEMTDSPSRDRLRQAAGAARHGPVWVTEDGQRIAAVVRPEVAALAEAGLIAEAAPPS
jgi:hypothetical protein